MYPMTPWVKRLLAANVAAFVLMAILPPAVVNELVFYPMRPYPSLGVYRPDIIFHPWTVITYMFLHAGLGHLFFNMIGLFFFGPRLEERLGSKGFLWLYFLSGIGGAAFSFLFARTAPVVGASAAVYGIILGFALYWPRERIYIWAILPVEAWLLAAIMVGASLWAGISGSGSGIAHFAHLGGLAFGFAYLKWHEWRRGAPKRAFQRRMQEGVTGGGGVVTDRSALKRWETIDLDTLHELNREEVRTLLEKARREGTKSLTLSERQFLDRMSARRPN
jgi:membrane associated rhomboid family serine protease